MRASERIKKDNTTSTTFIPKKIKIKKRHYSGLVLSPYLPSFSPSDLCI